MRRYATPLSDNALYHKSPRGRAPPAIKEDGGKENENRRSLAAPPAGSIRRFGKRPSRPPRLTLANVLAVSQAARTVVLLGDPQQLEQPMQGSHPEGTDVSALHHLLNGHQTIAADRGLFLEETWRLHPAICCFTSELFYEGRLQPLSGLEVQDLIADCRVTGTALRYLPVPHEGNQNASPEEAD
jgi:hypothetical protein